MTFEGHRREHQINAIKGRHKHGLWVKPSKKGINVIHDIDSEIERKRKTGRKASYNKWGGIAYNMWVKEEITKADYNLIHAYISSKLDANIMSVD
jgi:hypothetical protein